ncbi:MAG: DUF885 domain-containing protein [Acidobacteria bacterium]|nr:DUF885 domain-containing protein [Acidobacteriota bacterium]
MLQRHALLLFVFFNALLPSTLNSQEAPSSAASQEFHQLLEQEWEYHLQQNPVFASEIGDRRYNNRWPDLSLEAFRRRAQHRQEVLDRLGRIPLQSLTEEDRLNHQLFRSEYELDHESYLLDLHLFPLDQRGGIQTQDELADSLRFETENDYRDWIQRLRDLRPYGNQVIELMREGIRRGLVHPRVIMERVPDQIAAQLVDDPQRSPFLKPLERLPVEIPAAEREELRAEALRAISESVTPFFKEFQRFFEEEYLATAPEVVGLWRLKRGEEMYSFLIRLHTSTELSPREVHEIGLKEVQRIRAQMEQIIQDLRFEGSFDKFLELLRSDRRFYYENPQDLLDAYRAICKRIDPALVRLFGKLPRIPYGVEPIPEKIAPDTTTAYYRPPAADGSRAGTYFVNLYLPESRPKYEMEVLSVHEAVPGHHLQIALAMELDNLPAFRRFSLPTAFVEGWALYSESLGTELGLYQDPYAKFGQLTYEMWRAARLVIDTGLHALHWSRQQAIDFMKAHTAKTDQDIVNEVDRYIGMPGQALAYKIGELKIRELRDRARKQLGDRFDLRAFHDAVLSSGALPLDVLDSQITRWIQYQRKKF